MMIRPAKEADIDAIMPIVAKIKTEYFEKNDIPQWTGGYPSEDVFFDDLDAGKLFVLSHEDLVIGFASIGFDPEPDYAKIDGNWPNEAPYAVIHRVGIDPEWHGFGFGGNFLTMAEKLCAQRGIENIRADTHRRNAAMKKTMEDAGFQLCGVITLEGTDEADPLRDAYQKILLPAPETAPSKAHRH
ncbi:MAG TPA: GNAT family N-acetyltransferase [Oscillospiraceae bacterium]|nr:GNAT family N-acetyltransferase [Oscillospiraceae bacterium]HNW04482.1 GNAT family N-acetyltransferase [Oscillospiraceae bacterium]HPW00030.1 GNAT family N-acetyltransferase [Oscillospiraceae bacterium]